MSLIILIIVAVSCIIFGILAYGMYQISKIPKNDPAAFVDKKMRISDKRVVVCAGASIAVARKYTILNGTEEEP